MPAEFHKIGSALIGKHQRIPLSLVCLFIKYFG